MFIKKYAFLYKFRHYFARNRGLLALLVCCMLIASSMGVTASYLCSRQMIAITDVSIPDMVRFTLLILAVITIHHTMWFLWDKLSAIIGNRVARDIRRDILLSAMNTGYRAISENSTGYYLERLHDDTNEVSYFVQNVIGTLVDLFTNGAFLVIIYFQSWQCGLVFTICIFGLYLIDRVRIKVELSHTRKLKALSEALDSKTAEVIRGIRDIKGLGIKDEVIRQCDEISARLARQDAKMKNDVTLLTRVRTYSQWLIDALLVFMCAFWLFPAGKISVVILLIIFNYKGLMYETIGYFSLMKGYYVQGDFKAGRILQVIEGDRKDCFGSAAVPDAPGSVEVKNLSFSYGDTQLLHDVSFSLAPNTASVLLGASGSGKSTLFSLLMKLYDVSDNTIFINGADINTVSESSLFSHISIVNQEPFVFRDTVYNNLRIVKENATDAEIRAASKMAGIYDEIMAMKDGFDTVLADNGGNLSGGQKQRLSIARAILKDTPIILFDEPTSALDWANQTRFLNTVRELKNKKTLFVIAHKLDDLSAFDAVLEMKDGRCTRIERAAAPVDNGALA
jgi:ABC-type multidrug transport system fused ATPase/permease subunit